MENVIRSYLNDLLEMDTETLQDDNNLIEYGLNSLALIFILEKLSVRTKKKLNYADFVNNPTIKDWVNIIARAQQM
ncbi:acyl carrier protein [Brenneria goodwinii]|uniref:phosphopantetheine-binding protein n=1 Tax=Brenneria goodwinii TaxID=1109412 RepID=UPI000EF1F2C1|nr:phosphopantetheine-binding protein [Brenneria goodwinii]MCG8157282.1 acyl carrier protein [Brenneria goodwinii]MCG8162236.1 acyl carrier protein [Brenneria goodwinii]MCG8166166.1 acyl carrier protein [Brenneria goodwinii]MCG8170793.1 acyl carrier protein [Brenneria goodwinii]MCG8175863.1 acyl carrier protein [Brenneria goodwinii]